MNILLFGKNGQVGWELNRSLGLLGNVIALDRNSKKLCGDLTNFNGIKEAIRLIRPQFVVNAAAYTAVDKAETDEYAARTINAHAVGVIAEECRRIGSCLIHYSTDYVFDGEGCSFWNEVDHTNPINIYGKTKLEGEEHVKHSGCDYLIFRTSWVYSLRGNNFIKNIIKLASEKEQLKIVNDQLGAPTGAELLADATLFVINYIKNNISDYSGIYHLCANGVTSWFDLAVYVQQNMKLYGREFKVKEILPIPSIEFSTPARRPLNSRLNVNKFEKTFLINIPNWRLGVQRVIDELVRY